MILTAMFDKQCKVFCMKASKELTKKRRKTKEAVKATLVSLTSNQEHFLIYLKI